MNMVEYQKLAEDIHRDLRAANDAAARTQVYKENQAKLIAQYRKDFGVDLGDPSNLEGVKAAIKAETVRLKEQAQDIANEYMEIKNKDYAAEEAAKSMRKTPEESNTDGLDLDNSSVDTQKEEKTVEEAKPAVAVNPMLSAVASQESNAVFEDADGDPDAVDMGEPPEEEDSEEVEMVDNQEGIPQQDESAGSLSFAELIRRGSTTQSPYANKTEKEEPASPVTSDGADLLNML